MAIGRVVYYANTARLSAFQHIMIHQVSINFYKLTNKTKLVIELIKQDQTEQHLIRPAVCQMQAYSSIYCAFSEVENG